MHIGALLPEPAVGKYTGTIANLQLRHEAGESPYVGMLARQRLDKLLSKSDKTDCRKRFYH
jgi:hypothetical protein